MNVKISQDTSQYGTENVYFNATFVNNTNISQKIKYDAVLDNDFLNFIKLTEYYLGIIRFDTSLNNLAIMDFYDLDQTTNFSFTLEYNNVAVQQFCQYQNYLGSSDINENIRRFGYAQPIFNYYQIVNIWNEAIATAFTNLQIAVAPLVLPVTKPPFVIYTDRGIEFLFEENYNEILNGGPTVNFYFNHNVWEVIPYRIGTLFGYSEPQGKDFLFDVFFDDSGFTYPIFDYPQYGGVGVPVFKIGQRSPTWGLFYDILNLFIISNSFNTASDSLISNFTGDQTNIPVLLDLLPEFGDTAGERLIYLPSGTPRLVNILNSTNNRRLQFSVLYITKRGMQKNLYLMPGDTASVKFCLFKKSSYSW